MKALTISGILAAAVAGILDAIDTDFYFNSVTIICLLAGINLAYAAWLHLKSRDNDLP